jgi:hypothetical protein
MNTKLEVLTSSENRNCHLYNLLLLSYKSWQVGKIQMLKFCSLNMLGVNVVYPLRHCFESFESMFHCISFNKDNLH